MGRNEPPAAKRESDDADGVKLAQQAQTIQGPVHEDGFPVNVAAPDRAPTAAVVGGVAMVAQHVITIRLHFDCSVAGVVAILRRDVRLRQRFSVDDHLAVVDERRCRPASRSRA